MEDFQKYLSTAPVLLTIWMTHFNIFQNGFIHRINEYHLSKQRNFCLARISQWWFSSSKRRSDSIATLSFDWKLLNKLFINYLTKFYGRLSKISINSSSFINNLVIIYSRIYYWNKSFLPWYAWIILLDFNLKSKSTL